jgi:GrpB-like predicted nucleotidyltransferase (UPF0157 family)
MPELVLVEYQHHWPVQFQQIAEELLAVFAPVGGGVQVEHIGSTAVPGLCAKPVLDVLLGAQRLADVESRLPALAHAGYTYRPEYEAELPLRRYFVRAARSTARVHLHAVQQGGSLWARHLFFRDQLRQNASLRDQYADLKRELAKRHANDKSAYTQAKGPFIQRVLADRPPA